MAGDAGKMGAGEGELSREPEWSDGGPRLGQGDDTGVAQLEPRCAGSL